MPDLPPPPPRRPSSAFASTSKNPQKTTEKPRDLPAVDPDVLSRSKKYRRGDGASFKNVEDKKVRSYLKATEKRFNEVAIKTAEAEKLLLPEEAGYLLAEGMEKTYKFSQKELSENVDLQTQNKMFDLRLDDFGPYSLDYTRNGRHMLIGGRKGHLATFDWKTGKLGCELHVAETVRDVKWLHNETMFAVAQKKYIYIYDNTGMEIHCLRKHVEVNCLEFLPYHFLLAAVGNPGYLRYTDTSTGQLVCEHKTKLGSCNVMAQNPHNAILNLGHHNGTVTLWSPSMSTPLVKMLCHKGPLKALAIDRGGYYMASSGLDGQLKVWDIRTYKLLHSYFTPTPAQSLDISHTGLLGVGYGPHVSIWKDALRTKQNSPYMNHLIPSSTINDIHFAPFEDCLGVAHSKGISSLVIPGAGEANYDAMELNPYQTKKQRREKEVHQLLEKLQPETISLNPEFVGGVDRAPEEVKKEERRIQYEANHPGEAYEPRNKARGRNKSMRRYLSKQQNVIDPKREALRTKLSKDDQDREKKRQDLKEGIKSKPYDPLDRFKRRKAQN